MKFKYTTSNNETAEYEAIPLTTELYDQLLEIDREFLTSVSNGEEPFFNSEEFKKTASEMLTSFGKGKEADVSKTTSDNVILFVQNKKSLEENALKESKEKTLSLKRLLRSHFITSKIRSFKREKMQLNQEMDN
jgi:hypothetical protein